MFKNPKLTMSFLKSYNYSFMNKFILTVYFYGLPSLVGSWLLAFLLPVASFLTFTVVLVICDLITGVMAAHKRKEKIHSKGIRRTIAKIMVYFIAILLSEGLMKVYALPYINATYAVSIIISIAEFKSVIENVEIISNINIWSTLKKLFTKTKMNIFDETILDEPIDRKEK